MILSFTKRLYAEALNKGIKEGTPFAESKYLTYTNFMSMLAAVGILLYIPYSVISGNYVLAVIQAVDVIAVACVLPLNSKGHSVISRFLLITVINSLILMNACYIGYESKMHEFFYLTNIMPFFLFPIKQVRNLIIGMAISVTGFALYLFMHPYFTAYNLPIAQQENIYFINVIVKFVLFGASIFVLAWYNHQAESTLAESNEKLTAYSKELERSNADLENFAYVISHDLKAPIKNISSLLQLYISRYDAATKDGGEFLVVSLNSAQRLSKLIEDMLAYSRIGKNLPAESTVDTNLIVKTIEIELSERIKERNAQVVVAQQLPVLYKVHSSMLYHVFQNLITNAIKFNKSEKPTVVISHEDIGTHYRFKVQDNGIGMKRENTSGLFQMFRRLHTTEEYEGTGIGLAICKRVVSLYNGKIFFDSIHGQGTTFYFDIQKAGVVTDQLIEAVPTTMTIAMAG